MVDGHTAAPGKESLHCVVVILIVKSGETELDLILNLSQACIDIFAHQNPLSTDHVIEC